MLGKVKSLVSVNADQWDSRQLQVIDFCLKDNGNVHLVKIPRRYGKSTIIAAMANTLATVDTGCSIGILCLNSHGKDAMCKQIKQPMVHVYSGSNETLNLSPLKYLFVDNVFSMRPELFYSHIIPLLQMGKAKVFMFGTFDKGKEQFFPTLDLREIGDFI